MRAPPDSMRAPPEELEITRLLFQRLQREEHLDVDDRETVAYRIAEIMVSAKQMYTQTLPRLINVSGESTELIEDDFAGLRSRFEHLCDLMLDFHTVYMQALRLPPPETTPESEDNEDEENDEE